MSNRSSMFSRSNLTNKFISDNAFFSCWRQSCTLPVIILDERQGKKSEFPVPWSIRKGSVGRRLFEEEFILSNSISV